VADLLERFYVSPAPTTKTPYQKPPSESGASTIDGIGYNYCIPGGKNNT
jgi:hypothetical protein